MSVLNKVVFKMFAPGNKTYDRLIVKASSGKEFSSTGIEAAIRQASDKIEELHPGQEYKLVHVGGANYNLVWQGEARCRNCGRAKNEPKVILGCQFCDYEA